LSDVDVLILKEIVDDIEFMVAETFKHLRDNFHTVNIVEAPDISEETVNEVQNELPQEPGLIYHLQKSSSLFVIRAFVSCNIQEDYQKIIQNPEDYPSLRLLEGGRENIESKLRFFILDSHLQAEIIYDQLES
jgi:hypothetical protein